ncbi:MAG TPA: hypothetical protein VG253_15125 [Streptosporangiaceae bacterium]|nr:hypothetical protein [Streptosporangiaceae bacterium]
MTGAIAAIRLRPRSRGSTVAAIGGALVALLIAATVPLAILARENPLSNTLAAIVFGVPCAVVGFVVASRKPRNVLGWLMIAVGAGLVLSSDAGLYAVADFRLRHGGLPLGWLAVLVQPLWEPSFILYPLVILLFPDGRLPSRSWRWVLGAYLAIGAYLPVGIYILTFRAVVGHHIHVLQNGDLAAVDHPSGIYRALSGSAVASVVLLVVFWLIFLAHPVAAYRRSTGDRRHQLKWLATGGGLFMAALIVGFAAGVIYSHPSPAVQILLNISFVGVVALPVGIGVGILKYRLYEIDRLISRTLGYALVTGVLVGVYSGLVLLSTRVLSVFSPVAVAASTLAAAALFSPLRRRVQRVVDRRFNRARYDADRMVAAFAARLTGAVDLGALREDLAGTVQGALEPAHLSVWIAEAETVSA